MKQFIILLSLLSVSMIDFTGCRNKYDNPIGITDSTMVGASALSGRVVPSKDGYAYDSYNEDIGGIKIQLLNTVFQTESDKNGRWKIQNLDSGTYTVQYTKPGYDTVIIPNVLLKNKDSLYIGRIGVSGERWGDIVLNEVITSTIINPSAQIVATVLREVKDRHDSSKVIDRVMGYDFSATVGIEVRGLTLKTWDQLIIENICYSDIAYAITNTPTVDMKDVPVLAYDLKPTLGINRIWNFVNYSSEPNKISKTGEYTLSTIHDGGIMKLAEKHKFDLTNKEQLYLHIIPIWKQWVRKNNEINNYEKWKRGEVVTIPIVWK